MGAKGGTFVLPVTANAHRRTREEILSNWEQMLQIFQYRTIVEPESAYLAAERITDEELSNLQNLLDQSMEQDCTREWFRALDVKFHLAIAKASGNDHCEAAVRKIRTKINPALDLMPYNDEIRSVNCSVHYKILQALQAHDGHQSREVMKEHVSFSAEAIYTRLVALDEVGVK
ncbi:transcriptional regulator NanR [compost metagenome]